MKSFVKSFKYALHGLGHSFTHERNFRLEIYCGFAVCIGAFVFNISKLEWFIVIINIAAVLAVELINTAIENVCDMIHPSSHPTIKIIKDVSAAAVVITALCAFVCGCIIFVPYIINLSKS
jgi:diacylglycerol kinase